jgi:predicted homoserine dehydrogenase-like protein
VERDAPVITDDPFLLCRSPHLDALMDVTGAIELGTQVALASFEHRKHPGPDERGARRHAGADSAVRARQAGVVLSTCDGDQPAVQINLHRFVTGIGLVPRVMGNIKGLQDRTARPSPEVVRGEVGQKPEMVTAFADGSKVNFEQAIVANATGLTWPPRHVRLRPSRTVDCADHALRPRPAAANSAASSSTWSAPARPGIFCLAEQPDVRQRHYLNLYKLGRARCTASTRRTTCATSRRRRAWRARAVRRLGRRAARRPLVEVCAVANATCAPARCSTATGTS